MENKPSKFSEAVALRYDSRADKAPKVTAKGKGYVAEKILEIARRHKIPVKEDPELLQVLSKLDLNHEIPPHVYQVVAELLAFVYSVNKRYKLQDASRK
jgi:flagellar biosynthesis protein